MTNTILDKLCDELAAFCAAEALPQQSADELLFQENLSTDQRKWLVDFVARWEKTAAINSLHAYLDKNYVKLVGYAGFVAISPDRTTLFDCPEMIDGTPEQSWTFPGHLNFGEVTAPDDQAFLDAVNRIFGTAFRYKDFAGR